MAFSKTVLKGRPLTKTNFKTPPPEMGILPFWFWNGKLEEQELDWQMRQYKEKGIQGLFIHGRFGLKVPYLSAEWFKKVKYVVNRAKRIGLDIWIYDEMNWPSGTAERQVLKKYPYLAQKYLEMVILNIPGPLFTFLEASDNRYINTGNAKPIAAFVCKMDEFETGIKNIIDLTPNLSFEKVIPWEAPPGNWKLLYFLEKEADYYIDALDPESTNRFIEITHQQYKKAVGKSFGKIVPGFYTDEPAMHYYHVGMDNYIVPWSSRMFKIFRERRGYDLKPFLPALYTSMGKQTAQIRHDFWSTLTEQYSESYYKQLHDWCEKEGVIFTGHLLLEDRLRLHARCEGNIFKHLKHLHLPGVDHLYPVVGSEKAPEEHVALKMVSSAAHHFGKPRLLCESMGGTYWDCTLERMKWIANWECALGVSIFNNHGYHYSIEGERKRDWPPSQFYHHTWWKYYRAFTTYMARLGHILSGGRHVAKILLLYPIDCLWANYVPQQRDALSEVIEYDFYYLTDLLLRLHFDFDYIDEDLLQQAKISKGKISTGKEEYSLLILPPLTHIKKKTFEVIKKYINSGGYLIADNLLPLEFLNSQSPNAVQPIEKYFSVNPRQLLSRFEHGGKFRVLHPRGHNRIYILSGKGLYRDPQKKKIRQVLESCLTPDVTIGHEDVFYLHRIKDGYDIYFLANISQRNIGKVQISFEKIAVPELWDATNGEMSSVPAYQIQNNRMHIELNFSAAEAHIIVLKQPVQKPYISETNLSVSDFDGKVVSGYAQNGKTKLFAQIETQKGVRVFRKNIPARKNILKLGKDFEFHIENDNVLSLAHWKMRMAQPGDDGRKLSRTDYADRGWLDVTMGAWEMQLPSERENDGYPVTLWYRTSFIIENLPTHLSLLIDGFSGSSYRLFVNGQIIQSKGKRSAVDAEIKSVNILPQVKKGRNCIGIRLVVHKRTDGILDLLKMTGDFALLLKGNQFCIAHTAEIMRVGDWTRSGFPFFSGTGVYNTNFHLPALKDKTKCILHAQCGEDVLEVLVNNIPVGVVCWHPYRLDISSALKPGRNTMTLKITNTSINMLEAVKKMSGLLQEPYIAFHQFYSLTL